jgi:hypothetical protein
MFSNLMIGPGVLERAMRLCGATSGDPRGADGDKLNGRRRA